MGEARAAAVEQATAVVERHWQPRRVAAASFFYVTRERVAVDLCVEEPGAESTVLVHAQHSVDLYEFRSEIVTTFILESHRKVESCIASFI